MQYAKKCSWKISEVSEETYSKNLHASELHGIRS